MQICPSDAIVKGMQPTSGKTFMLLIIHPKQQSNFSSRSHKKEIFFSAHIDSYSSLAFQCLVNYFN